MSKGTPMIGIRISPQIREELQQIADREGITLSEAIRRAIVAFISEKAN